jgi:head-tail adaptor
MDVGGSRWRLTLLAPDLVDDGMKGFKPNPPPSGDGSGFVQVGKVWGTYQKPSIREMQAIGTVLSDLSDMIIIRKRSDICRGWHVQYGTKTWKVLHKYDPDFETSVIVCREVDI